MQDLLKRDKTFRYQMLGRLRDDCDYYLGCGNKRSEKLWALSEKEQIETMEALRNSFLDEEKPEWLTWEQIMSYKKRMLVISD